MAINLVKTLFKVPAPQNCSNNATGNRTSLLCMCFLSIRKINYFSSGFLGQDFRSDLSIPGDSFIFSTYVVVVLSVATPYMKVLSGY